jgi:hypothetical protein
LSRVVLTRLPGSAGSSILDASLSAGRCGSPLRGLGYVGVEARLAPHQQRVPYGLRRGRSARSCEDDRAEDGARYPREPGGPALRSRLRRAPGSGSVIGRGQPTLAAACAASRIGCRDDRRRRHDLGGGRARRPRTNGQRPVWRPRALSGWRGYRRSRSASEVSRVTGRHRERPRATTCRAGHYFRKRAGEYDDWWFRRGRYDHGPQTNARWFSDAAEADAALERFKPTGDVVEFACGTGLWTERLLGDVTSVTAIDGSPEMLESSRAVRIRRAWSRDTGADSARR